MTAPLEQVLSFDSHTVPEVSSGMGWDDEQTVTSRGVAGECPGMYVQRTGTAITQYSFDCLERPPYYIVYGGRIRTDLERKNHIVKLFYLLRWFLVYRCLATHVWLTPLDFALLFLWVPRL